ncbi:MAG TPA: prephenate dehydrogenase/arogenate dehydrogenase family protein [Herpetosiphonaceae bacterium]
MNVSVIGLGLIGGSLGLALRESSIDVVVSGWDRDPTVITTALECGAIDRPAFTLHEAVREADLVVVATPVMVVQAIFAQIAPDLKCGAIVSDVSSTKAQVAAWARALLPPHVSFIGGHPMAGSERHGVVNARADLFRSAVYCLTPDDHTAPEALALLESLVASIGARPLCLSADDHDAYVAAVSHLPFLLSTALAQITTQDPRWAEMSALAATGYRDLTRLASGDPVMHRDICLTNADAIQRWLRHMAGFLDTLADRLDDAQDLHALFDSAKQGRDAWFHERQQAAEQERSLGELRAPDPALNL